MIFIIVSILMAYLKLLLQNLYERTAPESAVLFHSVLNITFATLHLVNLLPR